MGISIWQLLIVLLIVLLLFGTKKLRNMGGDLGGAIKNFKTSMKDGREGVEEEPEQLEADTGTVMDSDVASKEQDRA